MTTAIWIAIAVSWLGGYILGVEVERRRSCKIFLATTNAILKDVEEINKERLRR